MADKLTLVQEELLSEKVKLFPCLFDKADKGHSGTLLGNYIFLYVNSKVFSI